MLAVLAEVFNVDIDEFRRRRRNSALRATAAQYLIRYAGQSQREVAKILKVGSGSAISKQMLRYRRLLSDDRRMSELLKRAEKMLEEKRAKS